MNKQFIHGNHDLLVLLCDDEDTRLITDSLSCSVLLYSGFNWDDDLTPWPAQAVFKGRDFGGQADTTIQKILNDKTVHEKWDNVYICGYSLAGLFALYMTTKTDLFYGVASVSGSLWYDGFIDYLNTHRCLARKVYISVGDKEGHSRNERMRTVIDASEKAAGLTGSYAETRFELNPGNHFEEPEKRMRRGIDWLMNNNHN